MTSPIRFAWYGRLSTDDRQDATLARPSQQRACQQKVDTLGGTIGGLYTVRRGVWNFEALGKIALGTMREAVIINGSTTPIDVGTVTQGQTGPTRTFTVRNDGTDALTVGVMVGVSVGVPVGVDGTRPAARKIECM